LRQQNAEASVIAGSTIEACRGLFNNLRRSNAALSDNSIQTMAEELPPLFDQRAAIEYFAMLPICHGFPARSVAYYLKWRDRAAN
jgi:hypothetical protein